ncbi:hypothetical protein TCAL_02514 [Tigriopus californicus]|uniref:Uncharacterized protein n=1 Tax=Tigriopus californicus TaxID=6832 RepID=A0A553NUL9_TIGCA|nr:uncharacterized protein LOC131878510 [Tigriopus californicus]TRY69129.1 hypothetical protein TCAL_02514 [Tigriopus californicus]|eukprot:TCALIF_02514-PA protein Name:"Protein of unknown function" AED:0.00 eAED:0.00 QI:116/1/1/1/1/1/5/226/408
MPSLRLRPKFYSITSHVTFALILSYIVPSHALDWVSSVSNRESNVHDGSSLFLNLANTGPDGLLRDYSTVREEKKSSASEVFSDHTPIVSSSVTLIDPGLDARKEIATYNLFMDAIFLRMNAAIRSKNLDPMDLKLLPNPKPSSPRMKEETEQEADSRRRTTTESILILSTPIATTTTTTTERPHFAPILSEEDDQELFEHNNNVDTTGNSTMNAEEESVAATAAKIRGWLYGMSTLKRSGDVSIFIRENYRTIQCPFALGPLELKVSKTVGTGKAKRTKSATAKTDRMLGLMDLKIDRINGEAEITNVFFDELGGVDLQGNLRRRADTGKVDQKQSKYRLVLASKAALSIKKVARLVVSSPTLLRTRKGPISQRSETWKRKSKRSRNWRGTETTTSSTTAKAFARED